MFTNQESVNAILSALGEQYAALNGPALDFIVCGGSALQALGLVERTTKDVDVLALVGASCDPLLAEPLPPLLIQAVKKVARDFHLPETWLNPGPTSAVTLGLPNGLIDRAEIRHYGSRLTVRFISRYDQIHLKLYAAADHRAGKHYEDLQKLNPTEAEIEAAARWTMTHDPSKGFKQMLREVQASMGYNNAAQRI